MARLQGGILGSSWRATGESEGFTAGLVRYAARRPRFLCAALLGGFAAGVGYRLIFNPAHERDLGNFVRSGFHGMGLAATVWCVLFLFASSAQTGLGDKLRRLPLGVEVLVRAAVMTAALVVVGVGLQFLLYAEPYRARWITRGWLESDLPRMVILGFGLSLIIGASVEIERLIGAPLLASVLLGTYHRPSRQQRIVMFLDLANSTRLAEAMGELRVHDLITRFFFDIDAPISDCHGEVHAYVGDEVIVSWPLSGDADRNARSVACFFAIDAKMARLAPRYRQEFGVAPTFRAGVHAGPVVVSECGDAKRQLAFFGDTMNVAARLCDTCKAINARLVISGDLLHVMKVPDDLKVSAGENISIRGRESKVEAHVVERR